jgi:hypothetical protein
MVWYDSIRDMIYLLTKFTGFGLSKANTSGQPALTLWSQATLLLNNPIQTMPSTPARELLHQPSLLRHQAQPNLYLRLQPTQLPLLQLSQQIHQPTLLSQQQRFQKRLQPQLQLRLRLPLQLQSQRLALPRSWNLEDEFMQGTFPARQYFYI